MKTLTVLLAACCMGACLSLIAHGLAFEWDCSKFTQGMVTGQASMWGFFMTLNFLPRLLK